MKILIAAAVGVILVGGAVYYVMHKSTAQETPTNAEVTTQTNTPVGTEDYLGEWFKVTYPANFVAKKEGPDEASFTSPDGSVQFYVYSPQWAGDPVSYLQALPTETIESDTTTPETTPFTNMYGTTYDKKVTRWVTFAAKDGSYKRSFASITAGIVRTPDSTDYSSKTRHVFGITYKNQAIYDAYLDEYLAFKESLVQYAD